MNFFSFSTLWGIDNFLGLSCSRRWLGILPCVNLTNCQKDTRIASARFLRDPRYVSALTERSFFFREPQRSVSAVSEEATAR